MDQVTVNVEQRSLARLLADGVSLPDLLKERARMFNVFHKTYPSLFYQL
jgi:hypothetical protein